MFGADAQGEGLVGVRANRLLPVSGEGEGEGGVDELLGANRDGEKVHGRGADERGNEAVGGGSVEV